MFFFRAAEKQYARGWRAASCRAAAASLPAQGWGPLPRWMGCWCCTRKRRMTRMTTWRAGRAGRAATVATEMRTAKRLGHGAVALEKEEWRRRRRRRQQQQQQQQVARVMVKAGASKQGLAKPPPEREKPEAALVTPATPVGREVVVAVAQRAALRAAAVAALAVAMAVVGLAVGLVVVILLPLVTATVIRQVLVPLLQLAGGLALAGDLGVRASRVALRVAARRAAAVGRWCKGARQR